ncbi:MAG TPA: DCC1-like thiol-disulfide oxidoreductase family protein [Humisphaera sp.]
MAHATQPPRYVVFYDGHCRLCTDSKRTLAQMDSSADLQFVNVQDWSVLSRYPQVDPAAALGQMHVITPDGTVHGGYDALVALLPAFPSLKVFHPLMAGRLARDLGRRVYRWVAANRYKVAGTTGCAGGACKLR